ncbi:MAG: site-specific DNA-methyltransferase [Nitrospiria bacterium]
MPTLDFKGKQFVYAHHLTVPFRQLNIDGKKSLPKDEKASLDDNLIIHGDNLHALKALLPKYAGRVDCIFIDPPYNTGNEGWCYSDNVNAPLIREWLKDSANPIDKEDLERHDKWLSMMWPRVQLLRELLADHGSLWVTLDDNEVHRARLLLDEIFGEENHLGTVIWEKADSPKMDVEFFSTRHDYVLVYAKNRMDVTFNRINEAEVQAHYDQKDAKGRQYYLKPLRAMGGQGETREARPNLYFGMRAPDGSQIFPKLQDGSDGAWRWGPEKVEKENDRIEWKKTKKGWTPYFRIYADTLLGRPAETIFPHNKVGSSRTSKNQLKQLFPEGVPFDTPKPVGLLKLIVEIATEPGALILDSFAGSGTTAHAVLSINKEDDGNRKFILVECEDYADKTTAERVRRVIKGVKTAKDESVKKGLGGSFTFCELGDEINIENLLKGEKLPSYDDLAQYAFYTATGQTLDKVKHGADFFVGETANYRVHVIYQPDTHFLRSQESALNMPLAERISKGIEERKKTALIFATHKFMGQKELSEMGITYCQLPYAIHRVMGD